MRMIDAEAFRGKLIRELNKTGKYTPYECGLDDALSYLNEQPTVDAVPVVHGRWEEADDGDGAVCSACGEDFCNIYLEVERFNYCPNCGSDMREGRTE